tara:strand:- start:48 stop:1034 length:987 start_codon:yes stop_codon:yes gene_type:complete
MDDIRDILNKRKEIRAESAESEPQTELPTENVEESEVVEDVTEDVIEDTASPEEDVEDDNVEETEELEDDSETEDETIDGNEEEDFYQFTDFEATEAQIKKWKSDNMKHSDYTKKTQELATEKKEFQAQKDNVQSTLQQIQEKSDVLQVLINETEDDTDWADLKEYEPAEYLAQKEKQDKRKNALTELKGLNGQKTLEERNKLFASNPHWVDGDKFTDAYNEDMTAIDKVLKAEGFTAEDTAGITSHKVWNLILKAAKTEQVTKKVKSKEETLKKKFKKAPIVTKKHGKTAPKTGLKREIEQAQAKFKASGDERDFMAVRKLKRKLNS